jgi:hypothetical protein
MNKTSLEHLELDTSECSVPASVFLRQEPEEEEEEDDDEEHGDSDDEEDDDGYSE